MKSRQHAECAARDYMDAFGDMDMPPAYVVLYKPNNNKEAYWTILVCPDSPHNFAGVLKSYSHEHNLGLDE